MGVNERPTSTSHHFRFSLPLSDAERLQLVTGKCQLVTSWKENNHITVEPETCIVCFSLGMRVVAIERRVCPRPQSLLAPLLIAITILTPVVLYNCAGLKSAMDQDATDNSTASTGTSYRLPDRWTAFMSSTSFNRFAYHSPASML